MPSSARVKSILQALFVTFLWSTSWVLIKRNLQDIPPLIFAGLRYSLASIILLPGLIRYRRQLKTITSKHWMYLVILGLVFYTVAQGSQFLSLFYLDAVTISLLLNFTTIFVAVLSIFLLNEKPTTRQWIGIGIFLGGVLLYFYPQIRLQGEWLGYLFPGITVAANGTATLLGRAINRKRVIPPHVVTAVSMTIGSMGLLSAGLIIEPFPKLGLANVAVIAWLGVINTALAFTLWNHSQQVLNAYESSLVNNTILIQIAILAWIFLGERLSLLDIAALVIALIGLLLTSLKRSESPLEPVP